MPSASWSPEHEETYRLPPDSPYFCPRVIAWEPPVRRHSVASALSAEAISAAVQLSKDGHLSLTRRAEDEYCCKVPEKLQTGKDASRMVDGELHRAWQLDPQAAAWAQPAFGCPVELDTRHCAGTARVSAHDILGFFSADGCYAASMAPKHKGGMSVATAFQIECKCSAESVQLLAALAVYIGDGRVCIKASKHLGYYSLVSYRAASGVALRFFAHNWEKGGTKAEQLQLANLALGEARLGRGRGQDNRFSPDERPAILDARHVYVSALKRGKGPIHDPVVDRAFHFELFSKMSHVDFFQWLMGFWEGDGSVDNRLATSVLRFHQSDLGFLQGLSDALVKFGHSALQIEPRTEGGKNAHKRTRTAYTAETQRQGVRALAKEMHNAYVRSGLASFRKAKLLYVAAHDVEAAEP